MRGLWLLLSLPSKLTRFRFRFRCLTTLHLQKGNVIGHRPIFHTEQRPPGTPRTFGGLASPFRVRRALVAIQPPFPLEHAKAVPGVSYGPARGSANLGLVVGCQQLRQRPLFDIKQAGSKPSQHAIFDVGSRGLSGRITEGSIRSANSQIRTKARSTNGTYYRKSPMQNARPNLCPCATTFFWNRAFSI